MSKRSPARPAWRFRALAVTLTLGLGPVPGCAPTYTAASVDQRLIAAEAARLVSAGTSIAARQSFPGSDLDGAAVQRVFARVASSARILCAKESISCAFSLTMSPSAEPNASMDQRQTVTVTQGLVALLGSEDQLAFVIGHELGHHIARHISETQARQAAGAAVGGLVTILLGAAGAYTNPYTGTYDRYAARRDLETMMRAGAAVGGMIYSQAQEIEADYLGFLITDAAGYDPRASIAAFEAMAAASRQSIQTRFFGSHPGCAERIVKLRASIPPELPRTRPSPIVQAAAVSLPASREPVVPATAPALLDPKPVELGTTPAPSDDFWDRPFEGPVVVRTGVTSAAAGQAAPEPEFAEACAQYLSDPAMHLRCQWLTGPDRADYIPAEGWAAPLADQMRCHPLRENPVGYGACLTSRL